MEWNELHILACLLSAQSACLRAGTSVVAVTHLWGFRDSQPSRRFVSFFPSHTSDPAFQFLEMNRVVAPPCARRLLGILRAWIACSTHSNRCFFRSPRQGGSAPPSHISEIAWLFFSSLSSALRAHRVVVR